MGNLRNKKGMSPVIATVILVAVTIVVAVGVAYWMGGIATSYTRFESIQINSANAVNNGGGSYTVTLSVQNAGSADATINSILVNNAPINPAWTNLATGGTTITAGTSNVNIVITIPAGTGAPYTSGTSINIGLHSAAGKTYPQMVTLP